MKRQASEATAGENVTKSPKKSESTAVPLEPPAALLNGEFSTHTEGKRWLYNGSYFIDANHEKLPHGHGRKEVEGEGFSRWEYEGDFRNGLRWGKGTLLLGRWDSGGTKYVGEWVSDEKHGDGELTSKDGRRYEGQWQHNKWTGRGELRYPDGRSYTGR